MTQDNGMDAGPSWEELMAERDALSAERQGLRKVVAKLGAENREIRREAEALAAHVARLCGLGQLVREAATDIAHIETEELFDRAEKWDAALEDAPTTSLARHPDDAAVDRFAAAMKAKLASARAKGRDGWDDPDRCSAEFLADSLVGHVGKGNAGNLEDIANLAMMLHQRGDDPAAVAQALARLKAEWAQEGARAAAQAIRMDYEGAIHADDIADFVDEIANDYRRQAQEPTHD